MFMKSHVATDVYSFSEVIKEGKGLTMLCQVQNYEILQSLIKIGLCALPSLCFFESGEPTVQNELTKM